VCAQEELSRLKVWIEAQVSKTLAMSTDAKAELWTRCPPCPNTSQGVVSAGKKGFLLGAQTPCLFSTGRARRWARIQDRILEAPGISPH
jgi:hypothetical protein